MWHPIETAPQDEMLILDVGLEWPVCGAFNLLDDEWVIAVPVISFRDGAPDWDFEIQRITMPNAWMPMPETKPL